MNPSDIHILILAGGSGSRLWPLSKPTRPKQFIDIQGAGKSLLQLTYQRALKLTREQNVWVISHKKHAALTRSQLPRIGERLLLEPVSRNTGPCIAYFAHRMRVRHPEALVIVLPSDHLITLEDHFVKTLKQALSIVAERSMLLTLGCPVLARDTNFGYIRHGAGKGIVKVEKFIEKPSQEDLNRFTGFENVVWNCGIFAWSVESIIRALRSCAPVIDEAFSKIERHYWGPSESRCLQEAYQASPSLSIDHAVLQQASNLYVLRGEFGWSDVGTFDRLFQALPRDSRGNTELPGVRYFEAENNQVWSYSSREIVLDGVSGLRIVDNGKTLSISDRKNSQALGPLRSSARKARKKGD